MVYTVERDFVGYGANPPDPKWPNGARLALNFVMNFEEGSEYSIGNGDGHSEASLTESPIGFEPKGARDLAGESMFEYGSRVGFWRLMRLFRERGLPMTVFGCAMAMELNPPACEAIREAGHDVCSHGWRWIEHWKLSESEEREHIAKAIAGIEKMTGERPLGWYCRSGPGDNTRRLLVEEGGFLYDSDSYADELPYWLTVDRKPHLVVPYSLVTNDSKFGRGFLQTGEDFYTFCREQFDLLREEGRTQPRMMSVGMHMRLLGHPARASGLARFLDYVQQFDDVWVCRRLDVAKHWHEVHPYEG